MEESMSMSGGDPEIFLPPGFRFHPRDEEIITHYLTEKVMNSGFSASAIGEVNLNKVEPWDLPKKAKMGEKEWYFFCQNDRKYPTGLRTNRATESGYWKATGKDREIYRGKNCLVGMKKTLVFYLGRAPKGEKSNWVMHEYRLAGKFSYRNLPKFSKDEWVVCRIFHKSTGIIKKPISPIIQGMPRINSLTYGDYLSSGSLPPLVEPASSAGPSSSFVDAENNEFKGMLDNGSSIPISRSSGATFPSHSLMVSSNPSPGYPMNPSPNISSMLYNQAQNPNFFSVQGSAIDPAYLNQLGKIIIGGRSQETGLSTEISSSSAASKQEVTSNRPLEDQIECPPICPIVSSSDMLYFPWDY